MDIEEDIKIINNFVQNIENGFTISKEISRWEPEKRIAKAIEHILAEREEDKKKIDKLEKENKEILNSKIGIDLSYEDYIPKQKVKEGLEDIEDYFDRLNGPDEDMEYIRNIKKELLEDK